MEKLEYKVVRVRSRRIRDVEDVLNHINEVEGWQLVTFFRGAPLRSNPAGRLYAVLKRPFNGGND